MTSVQFLEKMKEILSDLSEDKAFTEVLPKLRDVKEYTQLNPNDKYTIMFFNNVINLYLSAFLKKELIDAFNLSDEQFYYKQISIYWNLPFTLHPNWGMLLPYIFDIPSTLFCKPYETFVYILNKYYPSILDVTCVQHIQSILKFVNENEPLFKGSKDDYYSLERELELYDDAMHRRDFKELRDFGTIERIQDFDYLGRTFMNKRVGNIGELYAYEVIRKYFYTCFVARDIKNGFGYDIYGCDQNGVETLFEIKTTHDKKEAYRFTLSPNEYELMRRCFNVGRTRYVICRVVLDDYFKPSYSFLSLKDNITLVDSVDSGKQFKLCPTPDNNPLFRKH